MATSIHVSIGDICIPMSQYQILCESAIKIDALAEVLPRMKYDSDRVRFAYAVLGKKQEPEDD